MPVGSLGDEFLLAGASAPRPGYTPIYSGYCSPCVYWLRPGTWHDLASGTLLSRSRGRVCRIVEAFCGGSALHSLVEHDERLDGRRAAACSFLPAARLGNWHDLTLGTLLQPPALLLTVSVAAPSA